MMGGHIMFNMHNFVVRILCNYHLGPHSAIAVWAILGALYAPLLVTCAAG